MSTEVLASQALQGWLEKLERLNPSHIELGLDRSQLVLERMGLSFNGRIITVGGTNGKGTTVALLDYLLTQKGFSVGVYTSPHLFRFCERIRINGSFASDTQLVAAFEAVEAAREDTHLTYFEFTTLAAAYLFSQSNLDFWLMEVGLGGRLDAVNLFESEVAAVTNIGLDHQDWLGTTLEQIGAEKAGIYREGRPAIFGSHNRPASIDEVATQKNARPVFAGKDFGVEQGSFWWGDQVRSLPPTSESYTTDTLSTVLAVLAEVGLMPSEQELDSLKEFCMPGRFQTIVLSDSNSDCNSNLIVDVAHNAESVGLLADRLAARNIVGLNAVVGFMQDKLAPALVTPMVGLVDQWVLIRPSIPRAASLEAVEEVLTEAGVPKERILYCPDMENLSEFLDATNTAVIYGSFYTVGESLTALGVGFG